MTVESMRYRTLLLGSSCRVPLPALAANGTNEGGRSRLWVLGFGLLRG